MLLYYFVYLIQGYVILERQPPASPFQPYARARVCSCVDVCEGGGGVRVCRGYVWRVCVWLMLVLLGFNSQRWVRCINCQCTNRSNRPTGHPSADGSDRPMACNIGLLYIRTKSTIGNKRLLCDLKM